MDEEKNVTEEKENLKFTDIEKWKKHAEENLDGWKRAKADYINLKKETDKKLQETIQYANAAILLDMLPVNDHFKLAMQHIPKEEREKDWVKGIEHIHKEFLELLNRMGIEEIKTEGEIFDPELHEAIGREKKDGAKPGTILKEAAPGYKLFNKVLQHAKVHVAE